MKTTIIENGTIYTYNNKSRCWNDNEGNEYNRTSKQVIVERNGKKFAEIVSHFAPIKKIWNDNYRNENGVNLTEKTPSFRSRW